MKHGLTILILLALAAPVRAEAEEFDLWFPVGERLEYKAYWGVIPVATSVVTSQWIEEDGRKLLSIQFRTKSNRFIETFYPIDDFLESVIDPETFVPVRFTKRLSEGRYRCDETTVFDRKRLRARFEGTKKDGNLRVKEYDIEPDTRDLISFMYFMRSVGFEPGQKLNTRVMADEKLYDLQVRVPGYEKVKLKRYGKVRSLRIAPKAHFQGLLVRKGRMTLWLSDDDRRILTKVSVKIPVASVNLKLWDVSGPGDDFWIKHKRDMKDEESEDSDDA